MGLYCLGPTNMTVQEKYSCQLEEQHMSDSLALTEDLKDMNIKVLLACKYLAHSTITIPMYYNYLMGSVKNNDLFCIVQQSTPMQPVLTIK